MESNACFWFPNYNSAWLVPMMQIYENILSVPVLNPVLEDHCTAHTHRPDAIRLGNSNPIHQVCNIRSRFSLAVPWFYKSGFLFEIIIIKKTVADLRRFSSLSLAGSPSSTVLEIFFDSSAWFVGFCCVVLQEYAEFQYRRRHRQRRRGDLTSLRSNTPDSDEPNLSTLGTRDRIKDLT